MLPVIFKISCIIILGMSQKSPPIIRTVSFPRVFHSKSLVMFMDFHNKSVVSRAVWVVCVFEVRWSPRQRVTWRDRHGDELITAVRRTGLR